MKRPVLLVIAGPNGSGKTTVTERLKNDNWSRDVEYLNPDQVAQDRFGGWNDSKAVLAAADWVKKRRHQLATCQADFAFETVLSHPSKIEFIVNCQQRGYFTRTFFVGTESPDVNVRRVSHRVANGGHQVPEDKIRSRYDKSLANFAAVLPYVDRGYLFDNSVDNHEARLFARTENGRCKKRYGSCPSWGELMLSKLPAS